MQPPTALDFVNRANADYIDQMQQKYQHDPRSVSEAWQAFFAGFEIGMSRSEGAADKALTDVASTPSATGSPQSSSVTSKAGGHAVDANFPITMGVYDMVHSFRELGHICAKLDPLGHDRGDHPLLHMDNFGMHEGDLDRQVGQGSFVGETDGTLRDLLEKLKTTYCSTIGVEYTGISEKEQRDWLQLRMEPIFNRPELSPEETHALMVDLVAAEEFELFLARSQNPGTKRFGIEGGEAFIPLVNAIVEHGATIGAEQFIMSMAHRGRLNTLAHVLNKPYETLLSEFAGTNRGVPAPTATAM